MEHLTYFCTLLVILHTVRCLKVSQSDPNDASDIQQAAGTVDPEKRSDQVFSAAYPIATNYSNDSVVQKMADQSALYIYLYTDTQYFPKCKTYYLCRECHEVSFILQIYKVDRLMDNLKSAGKLLK